MKNLLLSYEFDVSFMAIEKRMYLINIPGYKDSQKNCNKPIIWKHMDLYSYDLKKNKDSGWSKCIKLLITS